MYLVRVQLLVEVSQSVVLNGLLIGRWYDRWIVSRLHRLQVTQTT